MKKILIIYATAGEGHKKAAFAIKDAFDILRPADVEIGIIDALDYTNKFFKWLYPKTYLFMVTYIPTIWGFFYYCLDFRWLYPFVKFVRHVANKNNTRPFEEFLYTFKPDIVIATHFLASEVISNLKRQNRLQTKLITCVTDFRMHSFWFLDPTDFFCVGFLKTQMDLVRKWGVSAEKINIFGIPIHPKFDEIRNKEDLYNKLNLFKNLFTILITGGGFGVGPIVALLRILIKMEEKLQILVVCGHNEKLKNKIDKLITSPARPLPHLPGRANSQLSTIVKTYGFIDYVDELMTVSDVVITKAGGLICSEAIAKGLPLVAVSPIPGQESRNFRLLLENNAAIKLKNLRQTKRIIQKFYFDKTLPEHMKENIQKIKKQNPSITIAKFALGMEIASPLTPRVKDSQ